MEKIKVCFNGIKVNGILEKASITPYFEKGELKYICVYKDSYKQFSEIIWKTFEVKNNTDSQTDYFETDTITIKKDNPYFKDFIKACIQREQKHCNSYLKRIEKNKVRFTDYAKSVIQDFEYKLNYLKAI